ncbi:MAG: NADH-quinone oxidoreductase subunit L [Candidatus Latescibacteria bacterium]|nr:NADH-quinone oxidoreductase subunit L [Candidatus Latescibacterota bacterium]
MESHALDTTLRWIVLVPLCGAALNGLLLRRMPRRAAGLLACAAVGVSFLLSVAAVVRLAGLDPHHRLLTDSLGTWLDIAGVRVEVGFAMDQLSAVMALVVTGVGFLIHVYSLGYMAHDPGYNRFFTYLNLFIFAMMMLVLGENLVMLFVGWEGVGLCSYLLISFWFNEEANAAAGKKAFIVNRIGDFGFLLGMFVLGTALLPHLGDGEGVFSFRTIAAHAHDLAPWATAIALLLFLGATGKSAQIPLYVWLPDAMAGPTPVSALIHAATMVTAGVYMIARMNMVYVLSPAAMTVVAITGVVTALFAATIALTQNDIKKVLAYSTISQLGYMMLACGVGAFAAGIFHVMTHAFFKALLFLGAGSVIHAMSGEQDMRLMGGLRRKLPATWPTFLVGTVALAGVFPFAGFFSKDEILWKAFSEGNPGLWLVGILGAGLTAFYMMRLVVLTFFGENRASEAVRRHIHESPPTMTVPLVILAVLSVTGGWLGWPHFLGGANRFEQWLAPVFEAGAGGHGAVGHGAAVHAAASTEWLLAATSLSLALLGLYAGYRAYAGRASLSAKLHAFAGGRPHRVLLNKYYVDELYEASLVRPGYALSDRGLYRAVDVGLIDGLLVNGTALLVSITSALLRLFQNGKLRFYAYVFALGAAAFVLYLALTI